MAGVIELGLNYHPTGQDGLLQIRGELRIGHGYEGPGRGVWLV